MKVNFGILLIVFIFVFGSCTSNNNQSKVVVNHQKKAFDTIQVKKSDPSFYKPVTTQNLNVDESGNPINKFQLFANEQYLYIRDNKEGKIYELKIDSLIVYRLFHSLDNHIIIAEENDSISKIIINKHLAKYEMNLNNIEDDKYFIQIYAERRIRKKEQIVLAAGIGGTQPRNARTHYSALLQAATAPGIKYYFQLKDNKFTLYEWI